MKPNHAKPKTGGFTGWDLLIVLVTIVLAVGFLLPVLARRKSKSARIGCPSSLMQIGLAFRMWANDSGEKFPWQVSTNQGGTLELTESADPLPHFQAVSNELNSPKVLVCSSDSTRVRVASFDQLTKRSQLSYFVGIDATETYPQTLLSGDRNLSVNGQIHSGLVTFSQSAPVRWAPGLHAPAGNVAFADGSVGQLSEMATRTQLRKETNAPIRLVFP